MYTVSNGSYARAGGYGALLQDLMSVAVQTQSRGCELLKWCVKGKIIQILNVGRNCFVFFKNEHRPLLERQVKVLRNIVREFMISS